MHCVCIHQNILTFGESGYGIGIMFIQRSFEQFLGNVYRLSRLDSTTCMITALPTLKKITEQHYGMGKTAKC